MWYIPLYETTHFCPRPDPRGTQGPGSGVAFVGSLCASSLPDSARQRTRRANACHRAVPLVRRTNSAPCHPRVQPARSGGALCWLQPAPPSCDRAARGRNCRAVQSRVPSSSARFWLPDQPVDARLARQTGCSSGRDGPPSQHRDHAPNAQALRDQLETSQALDHQPRSALRGKQTARDRLLSWASQEKQVATWAIGFLDEVWWSRFALPNAFAWQSRDDPVRFVEQQWQKADPDAKALACYGVLWQRGPSDAPLRDQMSLRFVDGRPVSDIPTPFLHWCCEQLQAQGKTAWLVIWENASWHYRKRVRTWLREHNQQVKLTGKGVRILPVFLPKQSPWLNPIEPKWIHGKRAVVEPNGLLTATQLAERICAYFHCSYEAHLSIPEKAS